MSNTKPLLQAGLWMLLVVAAISGTWQYAQAQLRSRDVEDTLQPMAALLDDNRKILSALKSEGLADSDSFLLDTYLAQIRTDSVPKHAETKQRIDALVNNNTAIVTLLARYAPRARTSAFRAGAEKFRDYASRFRDRWQSVFEIFMAGGHLPAAGPVFPTDFADALAVETAAAP